MTTSKSAVRAALFVAGVAIASSASAVPMVDEILGASTNIKVGAPVSFTHDLTAQPNNYLAGADTIASADLQIVLTDDNGNENYTISFGTSSPQVYTYVHDNIAGNRVFDFSILPASLADLSATGMLAVTIAATYCNGARCGDYAFKFVSSTLTAEATQASPVTFALATNGAPEPGTLALLGLGLAGLAASRRRKQ